MNKTHQKNIHKKHFRILKGFDMKLIIFLAVFSGNTASISTVMNASNPRIRRNEAPQLFIISPP
jgi:hypothetical protein